MKNLFFISLLIFCSCNEQHVGIGSRIRFHNNYPLNSDAVLGYNKGGGGPWDCYWTFDGNGDYLDTPHNIDFWIDNSGGSLPNGSVMVGYEADSVAGGLKYLVSKSNESTPATDGDIRFALDTNNTEMQGQWRLGGGFNWNDPKFLGSPLTPDNRTVATLSRQVIGRYIRLRADEDIGTDLNDDTYTPSANDFHGTSDLKIAAHICVGGGICYEFPGRIYYFYWIKGVDLRDRWSTYILDETDRPGYGTPYPWEYYDHATYPQCYINFCNGVGATYTPEIQSGPNAPYPFTVHGNPVKDGA